MVLREGTVQQIGTPEELYRSPVNSYVAGFMGYRNLLAMDVTGLRDGTATVSGHGVDLVGTARDVTGPGRATVAIRPEDVLVADSGDNLIEVAVEVVEYHGREQAVEARLPNGQPLRLRSHARLAPGDVVTVRVPPDKVLVFAADPAVPALPPTPPSNGVPIVGTPDVVAAVDGPPAEAVAGRPAGAADGRTVTP